VAVPGFCSATIHLGYTENAVARSRLEVEIWSDTELAGARWAMTALELDEQSRRPGDCSWILCGDWLVVFQACKPVAQRLRETKETVVSLKLGLIGRKEGDLGVRGVLAQSWEVLVQARRTV
jgi:hypothetical protein